MLKVKDIKLADGRYGEGYTCTVEFQVGDYSYNTVSVDLPAEATRAVVDLVIKRAMVMVTVDDASVRIAGDPVPVNEDCIARPEFAEVEEPAPAPAFNPKEAF